MARITHVKKAQQRYETVAVLDENGQPKRTPVMTASGQQKESKRGLVFMSVTANVTDRPKPPYMCDYCGKPIEIGTPYKHITPKSGPYGGSKRTRHEEHPDWQVWEYSSSLSARLAEIAHVASEALGSLESADDATMIIDEAKEAIMEIANEKREGAQNIEDGFGHETEQSSELASLGDELESWADEGDSIDVTDPPEEEEEMIDCDVCDGAGEIDNEDGSETITCTECNGEGQIDNPEYDDDAGDVDSWRDALVDEIESWLGNAPG